jgi:hypothetical protein
MRPRRCPGIKVALYEREVSEFLRQPFFLQHPGHHWKVLAGAAQEFGKVSTLGMRKIVEEIADPRMIDHGLRKLQPAFVSGLFDGFVQILFNQI